MIDLGGRVALVTGGSRGIGRACCRMLAAAGARVAINYRIERQAAEEMAASIVNRGGEALACGADLTRADEAAALVDDCVTRLGALDIVVNNAGVWRQAPVDTMTDVQWQEMLDVNLTGTFRVIREAVPHLRRSRAARIVNISSTAGQRGEAYHAHYAATKGAIIALTKSLAAELGPAGILTNAVAPGWVDTDMSSAAIRRDESAITGAIPLGRVASADEIAGAVVFLASDLASFVNGEVLNVNGGSVLCG